MRVTDAERWRRIERRFERLVGTLRVNRGPAGRARFTPSVEFGAPDLEIHDGEEAHDEGGRPAEPEGGATP